MREDLTMLLDLIGSGKLKPVVDRELSLPETNEAFRLLEDRIVFGKVIVAP
jgi:alcohol dehydrogenase